MRRLVAARRPLQTQSAAISPSLTCRANRGHSGTIPTIRIPAPDAADFFISGKRKRAEPTLATAGLID
jgi:hypothetical protein